MNKKRMEPEQEQDFANGWRPPTNEVELPVGESAVGRGLGGFVVAELEIPPPSVQPQNPTNSEPKDT